MTRREAVTLAIVVLLLLLWTAPVAAAFPWRQHGCHPVGPPGTGFLTRVIVCPSRDPLR